MLYPLSYEGARSGGAGPVPCEGNGRAGARALPCVGWWVAVDPAVRRGDEKGPPRAS